jgi:Nif-specific regulatory protein
MKNAKQPAVQHIKTLTRGQFEELLRISELFNATTYEGSLMEDALDWVIGVVNAERGLCVKYLPETADFSIVAARNVKGESLDTLSDFSAGVLHRVIEEKKPSLFHDAKGDPRISQFESIQNQRITSVIGVPVLRDNSVWGVILVDTRSNRREFTEDNLIFLQFFSNVVSLALDRITRFEALENENRVLRNTLQSTQQIPEIIGTSPPMQLLLKMIHRVAQSDATVLLLGESGTGKDLVARAIHSVSPRRDMPYMAQFCGSIPDTLLESELFGYKKGAFTGANSDKKGLLEIADGGTFFLDEIADISMALQTKLLRVLENREFTPLGDTRSRKVDVRVIAATNKDLQKLVKDGVFREDLYYRLFVFPLSLPPLRDRREDIFLLADHFIRHREKKNAVLHPAALKKLELYAWPGNVRQLLNVIQRALILCDGGTIGEEHVMFGEESTVAQFNGTLEDFEILLLQKRLKEFNGNRTLTAQSLGVSVRWVQLKLKELDNA